MKENGIIHFLRFIISAILGFRLIHEFELEGIIPFLAFFGIYIAVSILLEIIRKLLFSKQSKNKNL